MVKLQEKYVSVEKMYEKNMEKRMEKKYLHRAASGT